MKRTIAVEIDALAFSALDEAEARTAAESFQAELQRILTELGLPPGVELADLAAVDLGTVSAEDARSPRTLGRKLARLLYERVAA
jgi:hypothetical protein